ncbi:protein kinase domain-containing protein, partial [Succinimonas sp.]|uniref:protein kinase domain-containing protein n=1 Tax=Succinimonas sp. TaxID=1936151 RepID=UPI00386D2C79
MSETKVNASFLDKLRGKTRINDGESPVPDLTGRTLGDFYAEQKMTVTSGEADIYRCSGAGAHAGKRYVLKYYRRENAVKPDVIEKLKGINNPCVAPVVSFGTYEKHQYAVLPYYEMQALSDLLAQGIRFSEDELRSFIIPSVIEGLKALHDAGILHKDLKPGNLIPDDTGEHIVLIDFGISSDAGKNTILVTRTGMTP